MKKPLLASLLILAMLLVLAPAAFAEDHLVTLVGNGGYFYGDPENTVYQFGGSYDSEFFTRDSCEVKNPDPLLGITGWYYDPECTELACRPGEWFDLDGDVTLYIGWDTGYTVTFQAVSGRFYDDTTEKSYIVPAGSPLGVNPYVRSDEENMEVDVWTFPDGTAVETLSYVPTGDVTLVAHYDRFYHVTYDANGGMFGDDPNDTMANIKYGAGDWVCDIFTFLRHPDRHKAFFGWYYDPQCTQLAYARNDGLYVENDVTLYAGWTDGWSVTFEAGDGHFYDDTVQYTKAIPQGEAVSIDFRPNPPEGMVFDHWELADGTVVDLSSYVPTRDVTLYAKYVRAYTVTYNANGGFFGNTDTTEIPYSVREGDFVYGYYYTPKHPDSHTAFTGWYLDAECTQFACTQNGSIMPSSDMTLYAGWTDGYIVTFDAGDGHYYDDTTQYTKTIPQGDVIGSDPGRPYAPEGMTFDHWELENGEYVDIWSYVPTGDVMIYAQYVRAYNVTFNGNGGWFWEENGDTTYVVIYSEGRSIGNMDYEPTAPGARMAFTGWYLDEACTQPACEPDGYTVTGDVTLYAGWTDGYIVTFDAGDGHYYDDTTQYTKTIPQGDVIGGAPGLYVPEGMAFDHWELADGTYVYVWEYIPSGDVTLRACYSSAYTVTLDANGGYFYDNPSQTTISFRLLTGQEFYGGGYIPRKNEASAAFNGWFYDQACTKPALGRTESLTPTGDLVLYAGWTEGYIVTFDPGEGSLGEGAETSIAVAKGSRLDYFPYAEPADTENYTFTYWTFQDGTRVPDDYYPTEDVTLCAHYAPLLAVSFDGNGGMWVFNDNTTRTRLEGKLPEGYRINIDYLMLTPTPPQEKMAFTGWYADAACTELVVAPGGELYVDKAMTLYAGWTDGFILTFDANGGTDGPVSQGVARDGSSHLVRSFPWHNSLVFVGWASSANADAPQYFPNEPISVNADTTLYAVWKQPDFVLPANLTEIGEEAFAGGNFTFAVVPWQVETIGPRAFADCPNLKYVLIQGYGRVNSSAFQNDTGLVLIAQNSNLQGFAQQNNYHLISYYY